jgi:hypothetical protein
MRISLRSETIIALSSAFDRNALGGTAGYDNAFSRDIILAQRL